VTGPFARGRTCLAGLAAFLVVFTIGMLWSKRLYIDIDGTIAVAQIHDRSPLSAALLPARISSLQGMGGQELPVNPWINPGYAVLLAGTGLWECVASYVIFAGLFFLAVYALGAALRIGPVPSVVAAQLACFLLFPPLDEPAGMYNQVRMNPGVVLYAAIALVLLALLIRGGTRTVAANGALVAAPAALFLYSVLCDPIWTVVPYLSLWVFFPVAFLVDRTGSTDRWRGGAVLFGAAGMVALGVPTYLLLLLRYTARARFHDEIVGEVQGRLFTSLPLNNPRSAVLFALLLLGVLLALRRGGRPVRLFAAACLAHMALLTGASLVFLYGDVNWTYPFPIYLQLAALPVYLLVAVAGWQAGWSLIAPRVPRLVGQLRLAARPLLAACLVPACCLPLIAANAAADGELTALLQVPRGEFLSGVRSRDPFARALEARLAVRPGEPFRGSAVVVYPDRRFTATAEMDGALVAMGVPTLTEYGQLVSPPFYFLASRGLRTPGDGPSGRNRIRVTVPRVGLLSALGVRYVLVRAGCGTEVAEPAEMALGDTDGCILYELPAPNVGSYSPMRVIVSRSAADTVALLVAPGTDLRRDVVLTAPLDGALVPARDASLRFVDGGVAVSAKSDGRSLLLLPVQFSHALRARTKRGDVRLVRANLAQTGLLFDREVDAFLTLDFGVGRTAGRARDLADLDVLGIAEDGTRRITPEAHDRLHPYARSGR
jgi:hypothetical protein